jgi:hypothetical protein
VEEVQVKKKRGRPFTKQVSPTSVDFEPTPLVKEILDNFEKELQKPLSEYSGRQKWGSKDVTSIARYGCNESEIAAVLGTTPRMVGDLYSAAVTKGHLQRNAVLRRQMTEASRKGNVISQIFSAKNYLGMSDRTDNWLSDKYLHIKPDQLIQVMNKVFRIDNQRLLKQPATDATYTPVEQGSIDSANTTQDMPNVNGYIADNTHTNNHTNTQDKAVEGKDEAV